MVASQSQYEFQTLSGLIIPDTAVTRDLVVAEYQAAFGTDFVTTSDTPQGVLIDAETLARDQVIRNNAALANQINPNFAGGIFLDALGSLTGLKRSPNTASVLFLVLLTGVAGTVVPSGVTAISTTGESWALESTVTLGTDGTATGTFTCLVFGPITCNVGDLNTIGNGVIGWETVTNPSSAVLGTLQQSDVSFGNLRRNTLALQGIATPEAIKSTLLLVNGVRSLKFLENVFSFTVVDQGITLVPHSYWVCVDGGSDTDIANTLLSKKSGGAGWNGSVSVDVVDPASGQTYTVLFDRPIEKQILCQVVIKAGAAVSDPITATKQAILDYANGNIPGENGFVVGGDVSAFELAGAVNFENPGIFVKSCLVSFLSPLNYLTYLTININEVPRISLSSIVVTVE